MDPYSSPYITHNSSFHFRFNPFIPSEPNAIFFRPASASEEFGAFQTAEGDGHGMQGKVHRLNSKQESVETPIRTLPKLQSGLCDDFDAGV